MKINIPIVIIDALELDSVFVAAFLPDYIDLLALPDPHKDNDSCIMRSSSFNNLIDDLLSAEEDSYRELGKRLYMIVEDELSFSEKDLYLVQIVNLDKAISNSNTGYESYWQFILTDYYELEESDDDSEEDDKTLLIQ